MHDSDLEDIEFVISNFVSKQFQTEKVLILISPIQTWGNTPPNQVLLLDLQRYKLC